MGGVLAHDGTGSVLRTALTDQSDTQHDLQVMRLYFDTEYCFQVYATTSSSPKARTSHEGSVSTSVPGKFTTGSVPAELAAANIVKILGRQSYDLTLMEFNTGDFTGAVAIDRDARIVWYYHHHTDVFALSQRENYNLVFNQLNGIAMEEIKPDGTSVDKIQDTLSDGSVCSPVGRWHHEAQVGPGNQIYTIGSEIRLVDFPEDKAFQGPRELVYWDEEGQLQVEIVSRSAHLRNQTGDTIVIWDQDGASTTQVFSLFDVLDPVTDRTAASDNIGGFKWEGCDGETETEDWTHSNALWVGGDDDNILMPVRHLNQIIAIMPDFSGLAWRLGGPGSDFTFPEPSDQFSFQHSSKMLANGNILLFDNGNGRPLEEGGLYSRALELKLDFTDMTAEKVWEYRSSPDIYSGCCSNVTRLENGNTVIIFGANAGDICCRTFTLIEADANGNTVSEIKISAPGKGIQYRVYPLSSINGEEAGPSLRILDGQSGLATGNVTVGSTVVMTVVAENASDVTGLQFKVNFDNSLVEVADVVQSPDIQDYSFVHNVNNEMGYVSVVIASATSQGEANVTVAEVTFQAVGVPGQCTDLTFSEQEGSDSSVPAQTIDVAVFGGSICIIVDDQVPALSVYALVLMAAAMGFVMMWYVRRRSDSSRLIG